MFSFYGKPVLLSWRQSQQIFSYAHRSLATKIKKSALLQDTERIPIVKYPRSTAKDRRVYVWGLAETGALGLQKSLRKASERHTAVVQHPSRLQFGEHLDVCDIACGYGFSAFAVRNESTGDNDGYSLFGSGLNTDSQIGFHKRGGETNQPLQQLIYPAPIQLPVADRSERIQIVACAAGRAHLMALSETGRVYTMGNNAYGQCGRSVVDGEKYAESSLVHQIDGIDGEKIRSIHCGQDHSLWLTETGKVYACGWGADGQTGLGHYSSVAVPSLVAGDIAGETIIKLAGTADCVLALNGKFFLPGYSSQCAINFHFLFPIEKGQVFGWGNSEYGQLETIGDTQQINVPQMLTAKTKGLGRIVDIAAGGSFCMILNGLSGELMMWDCREVENIFFLIQMKVMFSFGAMEF